MQDAPAVLQLRHTNVALCVHAGAQVRTVLQIMNLTTAAILSVDAQHLLYCYL